MSCGLVVGMFLLLAMQLVAAPDVAVAQAKAAMPSAGKAVPVTITSDHLDVWEKKQQALFTGNVHLVRGDFELNCDSLRVYYMNGKQGGGIDHALATGHVRMIQGDKKGTADSAIIDNRKHLVTLRGHAVMEQPGGRVAGDTIVHDTQAKVTQVFQGENGNRVSLHIDEKQIPGTDAAAAGKQQAQPATKPAGAEAKP